MSGVNSDTRKRLGNWVQKSENTTYQAESDGRVYAHVLDDLGNPAAFQGRTDSNNPPQATRLWSCVGGNLRRPSIVFDVRKGDYWYVYKLNTNYPAVVQWIPDEVISV
jgi:hypothetical protein